MTLNEGKNALFQAGLSAEFETEGETVAGQTPPAGECVNKGTKVCSAWNSEREKWPFLAFFKKNGKNIWL